jgi:hypothetical protein
MAVLDTKLNQFFSGLYGPLAKTEWALVVRHELKKFILSALAPHLLENRPPESPTKGRQPRPPHSTQNFILTFVKKRA